MKHWAILPIVVLSVSWVPALPAHHSLAETYEMATLVPLSGVISRVEVANPHVTVSLSAADSNGNPTTWMVEMAPPQALVRRGFDMGLLEAGRRVTVESWVRKDGTREATGRTLITADGARHDIGDSLGWTKMPRP